MGLSCGIRYFELQGMFESNFFCVVFLLICLGFVFILRHFQKYRSFRRSDFFGEISKKPKILDFSAWFFLKLPPCKKILNSKKFRSPRTIICEASRHRLTRRVCQTSFLRERKGISYVYSPGGIAEYIAPKGPHA